MDYLQTPWQIDLGEGHILRQGQRRDQMTLRWLTSTSAWVYGSSGPESLIDLITKQPSVLWVSGRSILAALLISRYRSPVAETRLILVRQPSDRQRFLDIALPAAETRLTQLGESWLSFLSPDDSFASQLSRQGYFLKDRVVSYSKKGLGLPALGDPHVRVRPASLDDSQAVLTVDRSAFEEFWQLNPAIVRQEIRRARWSLVTESGGQIVGYVTAHKQGKKAYISRIGVLPTYQRRGIASRLMVEMLRQVSRGRLPEVQLNTQETNTESRQLYEKLGFRYQGIQAIYWAKSLQAYGSPP